METFEEFLETIPEPDHRERTREVLDWVSKTFPNLQHKIAWNQPMFTDHGTFIIGFSASKKHLAAAPERVVVEIFSKEILDAGFEHSKDLIRFPWGRPMDYKLLQKLIEFNISEKADITTFWRKTT